MSDFFTASRRVEFRDTDMAGLMHFARYFSLMEEVEHEFLRSLGLSVHERGADGDLSWPRVGASCDYQGPVRFEDVLEIHLRVEQLGTTSITYGFEFFSAEKSVAHGKLTAVCCVLKPGVTPKPTSIPPRISLPMTPFVNAQNSES